MKQARQVGAAFTLALLAGCGGAVLQIPLKDGAGVEKTVELPKGTVFGGASRHQAAALAQMVAATNAAGVERAAASLAAAARVEAGVLKIQRDVDELQVVEQRDEESLKRVEAEQKRIGDEVRQAAAVLEDVAATTGRIDAATKKVDTAVKGLAEGQARLEETVRENLDATKKTWDTTRMIIEAFEKVARRQGTGEVTVFFPRGSAQIARAGQEERRLVAFVDWLARESRGRTIRFVAIGSASATGSHEHNLELAKQRSEALLGVIDKFLVNVPHEYVKMYGTGDSYSPKDVSAAEHERYQHARLIAFFEKDQEPVLPAAP